MTIRVGLELPAPGSPEPFGAWVFDLPGCYSPGANELAAIAGVHRQIERYLRLLYLNHIPPALVPNGDPEVVERFSCTLDGDYEVNASFSSDRGQVSDDEVGFARAVLAVTRPALIRAARQANEWPKGTRTAGEVLHHVASAEWFYSTRVERDPETLRRFGRAELTHPLERLGAVRAWVLARIDTLPSLGALERTHRGERWTPRKVLRRFIYHELDHLAELEARAQA